VTLQRPDVTLLRRGVTLFARRVTPLRPGVTLGVTVRVTLFPGRFDLVRGGHNRVVGVIAVWSSRDDAEPPWTPTWHVADTQPA
jgi:hypothetical protein